MDKIIRPDVLYFDSTKDAAKFTFRIRPRKMHLRLIDALFIHMDVGYKMFEDYIHETGNKKATAQHIRKAYDFFKAPVLDEYGLDMRDYVWQGIRLFEYVRKFRKSDRTALKTRSILLKPSAFSFDEVFGGKRPYILWNHFIHTTGYRLRIHKSKTDIYRFSRFCKFHVPAIVSQVTLYIRPERPEEKGATKTGFIYEFCVCMEPTKAHIVGSDDFYAGK